MRACALRLSVVVVIMRKGNGQPFTLSQCTLGNVASAQWAAGSVKSPFVESHCCVLGFTGGCVTGLSVSWLIPRHPQVLAAVFVVDSDTATTPWTLTHTQRTPHFPLLTFANTAQQHLRDFDRIDSANFIVVLQNEHLRVPQSWAVCWPSIHLTALFIVICSCSSPASVLQENRYNPRGLMKIERLCWHVNVSVVWYLKVLHLETIRLQCIYFYLNKTQD